MNRKSMIKIIFITLFIGALLFYAGLGIKSLMYPNESFMVYLNGKKVGLIKEKNELLEKINKEQSALKELYKVDNIYPPNGLRVVKYTTYRDNYLSINDVYSKIDNFTIKGYTLTIKDEEENKDIKLYALSKDDLTKALDRLVSIFVPADKYQKYLNDAQEQLNDTGEYVKNVYIKEKTTIKEGFISTSNTILTSYEDISRYLLYGTTEPQKKYVVKKGDTIESIAFDNGLSVEEFLIANPELKDGSVLLSGNGDQSVITEIIAPLLSVVYETDLVEEQVNSYNTITKWDPQIAAGVTYTQQKGENGIVKVKFDVQYLNGDIYQIVKISASELTPAIDQIVVRGGNKSSGTGVGNAGIWYWPTIKPYKITSYWGYRWSSFHEAIDIAGCGNGSPIYAANDGVVYFAGTSSDGAKTIKIDHNNGYYTNYVHLKDIYVTVGQKVTSGAKIGTMGNTGYVIPKPTPSNPYAGTHLHFGVYYSSDGGITRKTINPLGLKFQ